MLAVNLKPTVGPAKAPAAGRPLWSRDCEDMVLPRPAATGHYVELNIMAGCSQSRGLLVFSAISDGTQS
jgi:hypothetical protein